MEAPDCDWTLMPQQQLDKITNIEKTIGEIEPNCCSLENHQDPPLSTTEYPKATPIDTMSCWLYIDDDDEMEDGGLPTPA